MNAMIPFAGWTALITGIFALLNFMFFPHFTLSLYSFAGLALVNTVFFIVVDRSNLGKTLKSRQTLYGMNATVLVIVVFGILVFSNLLVFRHKQQFDYTETGRFTIAPQSVKILKSLDEDVKLIGFFTGMDMSRDQFKHLMSTFTTESDHIKYELIDPDRNPATVEKRGITTYNSVVVESGDKSTIVKILNEENLTNAILQVSNKNKKKVYFLEGHGEPDIASEEKGGYSKAREALEQDGFEVAKVLLAQTAKVPEDADLVIINGPKNIIPRVEQEVIEAYLNSGGSVLLMLDPQEEPGTGSFLKRWGIEMKDDVIVDPLSRLYGSDFFAPIIKEYGKHGITNNFGTATIFPLLRSVSKTPAEGIETQEFLFSGQASWAENEYRSENIELDESKDRKGPVPVAAASTKIISGNTSPDKNTDDSLPSAAMNAHLVVIGDSDFATNQYLNLYGNRDFFSNSAAWLMEEEDLISIRPKERKSSPLALTDVQGKLIFAVGNIMIPGAALLIGFRIWLKRRRL